MPNRFDHHRGETMQSELTTLEKYNDLDQQSRDAIGSLPSEDPKQTISNLSRDERALEKIKNMVSLTAIASALVYFLYFLGTPKSISGFIGGSLLFLFWGFGQSILIFICVEILFVIINKIFIKTGARHKFCALIETTWTRVNAQRKQAESLRLIEINRGFQRDFDLGDGFSHNQTAMLYSNYLISDRNELR
jgi:hypothetical protein